MNVLIWLQENWKGLGYPLALLFALLWWNKTTDCPVVEAPKVAIAQSQGVSQTAKASVKVQIVYRDRLVPGETPSWKPLPCPEVSVEADSSSEQTHWQSQQVTVTPQIKPTMNQISIFAGGGYLSGPIVQLGVAHDRLRVSALGWDGRIGGLGSWDF